MDELLSRMEPCPMTGCWIWLGSVTNKGYGICEHDKRIHRRMYELAIGPIPEGRHVLHSCDVRCCGNPAHLYLGSNAKNIEDKCHRDRSGKKLTIKKVLEIRKLHEEGVSQARLARRFGIAQSSISRTVHGVRWAHVSYAIGG